MFRDSRWWYHYWQRKGHVSKKITESFREIDCGYIYDNSISKVSEGDECYLHGYRVIIYNNHLVVKSFINKKELFYQIATVTTPCNYGGKRHWFICPNPKCNRRVKKMYLFKIVFLCRKCLNLGYYSQRQIPTMRHMHMKEKIEELLKRKGGDEYTRPRYMHKKTFNKLRDKYLVYDEKIEQYLMQYYPLL